MTVIDFKAFIGRLATSSGETILPFFRTSLSIDNKSVAQGFDPVTEADRAAEAVMRRLIKANFPQHGIVGEEFGNEREDAEYVWVLDPIDGTKSFIAGFPIWGTLIALLHHGQPVLGLVDMPMLNERWVAWRGQGARCNGRTVTTPRRRGRHPTWTSAPRAIGQKAPPVYRSLAMPPGWTNTWTRSSPHSRERNDGRPVKYTRTRCHPGGVGKTCHAPPSRS